MVDTPLSLYQISGLSYGLVVQYASTFTVVPNLIIATNVNFIRYDSWSERTLKLTSQRRQGPLVLLFTTLMTSAGGHRPNMIEPCAVKCRMVIESLPRPLIGRWLALFLRRLVIHIAMHLAAHWIMLPIETTNGSLRNDNSGKKR